MSEDSNKFIANLLRGVFVIKTDAQSRYAESKDFDDIDNQDRCEAITKNDVVLFRESEHYFTVCIELKNGNHMFVEAPIKKIQFTEEFLEAARKSEEQAA